MCGGWKDLPVRSSEAKSNLDYELAGGIAQMVPEHSEPVRLRFYETTARQPPLSCSLRLAEPKLTERRLVPPPGFEPGTP